MLTPEQITAIGMLRAVDIISARDDGLLRPQLFRFQSACELGHRRHAALWPTTQRAGPGPWRGSPDPFGGCRRSEYVYASARRG